MNSFFDSADRLEVVYYAGPVPLSSGSLTFLGLIFDRIHFPNVYLPTEGFDAEAVKAEADRIQGLGFRDYETLILIRLLRFLDIANQLRDVCYFTGDKAQVFGGVDKNAPEIVKALDEAIFGPPKDGFIPTHVPGSNKGLPGGEESIDYPGSLYYPANALIYASRLGIPVVNDQPGLPVPALGGEAAKNNAKILSTILAIECASLVLPKIRPLHPQELLGVREELSQYLRPFRLSLLNLATEINKNIEKSSSHREIVEAAKFTVETSVVPQLVELAAALEKPSKPWYYRAFDLAKQVPELATSFATMPPGVFAAKLLTSIGGVLVDLESGQRIKAGARSGMYYLLKLKEAGEANG
jgi:hypothetical protein